MIHYKKIIKNQKLRFFLLKITSFIPDRIMIKLQYKLAMGKKLNLDNPKTLNEKLQWLKLYDRKDIYIQLVDKYAVREYISEKIGSEYLVPLVGVYDSISEIPWDKLPDKFVIKCTHGSHSNIICTDKTTLNIKLVKKQLKYWLKQNFYYFGREWPYKYVKPRLIIEKYISDDNNTQELTDYKFYCFDGHVDSVLLCKDRLSGKPKFYFFDENWNLKKYNLASLSLKDDFKLEKPKNIEKMFEIAKILSKGYPFLRVDLYSSNDKIYFGELTLFPSSGYESNRLYEVDLHFGNLVNLPKLK